MTLNPIIDQLKESLTSYTLTKPSSVGRERVYWEKPKSPYQQDIVTIV